jgi:hypothetical protein
MNDVSERKLQWNGPNGKVYSIDPAQVPEANLFVLAQSGFTHKFGNEVSSALTAWRKTDDGKAASEDEIDAWLDARRAALLEKVQNGELGVRVSGAPRVTGIEAIMRSIATDQVKAKLANNKDDDGKPAPLAMPTGDKTIVIKGKEFDRELLITTWLKTREAKIRADAQARMDANKAAANEADDFFGKED